MPLGPCASRNEFCESFQESLLLQRGSGTEPEPETGTGNRNRRNRGFPGTERRAGTVGTVFQAPEPEPFLSAELY